MLDPSLWASTSRVLALNTASHARNSLMSRQWGGRKRQL